MSERPHRADGAADPWLTVDQVSKELSIHPSTVRLWLSQGRLAGVRVGGRKWRIRRSALDLMLLGDEVAASAAEPVASPAATPPPARQAERAIAAEVLSDDARAALEQIHTADAFWSAALEATTDPPPDLRFASRVRAIADAAEQEAAALRRADAVGFGWRSVPGAGLMSLSYELRPASNARRGSPELWERFDDAVQRLGAALAGVAPSAVARGFHEFSEVARELADDIAALDSRSSQRQAS